MWGRVLGRLIRRRKKKLQFHAVDALVPVLECQKNSSALVSMATLIPPPAKRIRREAELRTREPQDVALLPSEEESVRLLFCENGGNRVEGADVVEIPRSDLTDNKLSRILHALLRKVRTMSFARP